MNVSISDVKNGSRVATEARDAFNKIIFHDRDIL
jgi:hypothetical protein